MYTKNVVDGYFIKTVSYDRNLKYCPYGSAGVDIGADHFYLRSYTTLVIALNIKDGWLECTGTYSATTRKHIGAFLKEYAPRLSYYDIKRIAAKPLQMNIYTGAVRELP